MKMVKTISALTLLALTAINIYAAAKAKRACDDSASRFEELKGRLFDARVTVNALCEQIREHRDQLSEVIDISKARTAEKLIEEAEYV